MAEQKVFLGPRLRRMRNEMGLTQTAMASDLEISPSYLNLIERNQRPLTVQLILKLSSVYQIDPQELQNDDAGLLTSLKEVFSDPLLSGELPGDQELVEVTDAAPNAATGIAKLYRAYKEQQQRLSDLSIMLAEGGNMLETVEKPLPLDAVRQFFEERPNYFAAIDHHAEKFVSEHLSMQELEHSMRNWLQKHHNISVQVVPVHTMPHMSRRFDRHSMRLFLSSRLSYYDRLQEMAIEIALLALRQPIEDELATFNLDGNEAKRIAQFELARYAAHAIIMPYGAFMKVALRAQYDVDTLSSQFNVSFAQVANRLTTLQRPDFDAVPFFLMEVDIAGNIMRRAGARGFPRSKFGGACPKHSVYAAFTLPGQTFVERVKMNEDQSFITIARTIDAHRVTYDEPVRRTALMLACDARFQDKLAYKSRLEHIKSTDIGPACRLCEQQGCAWRAAPPVTRPLGLDEMVRGLSIFDFR